MQFRFLANAERDHESLSPILQKTLQKQLDFLVSDIRHPPPHAKKYNESTGLWQARINKSWRFYFFIVGKKYYIVSIRKHPK